MLPDAQLQEKMIRRKSLADEVVEKIRQQIENGELNEEEKLPTEPELMTLFGVGRSTIREAVKTLSNMGYLSVQQGRGTFVKSSVLPNQSFEERIRRADIQELKEVRNILEMPLSALAAQRRTVEDVERIAKYAHDRKEASLAGDLEKCIKSDILFHVSVVEATHNAMLIEIYRSIALHLEASYKDIYEDTEDFKVTQPLHDKLVRFIREGNVRSAARIGESFWGIVNRG